MSTVKFHFGTAKSFEFDRIRFVESRDIHCVMISQAARGIELQRLMFPELATCILDCSDKGHNEHKACHNADRNKQQSLPQWLCKIQ